MLMGDGGPEHRRELRISEERFRLLVEGVLDYAIFMLDPGGHIISWNSGAERLKGWRAEEIIGQHFSVFYTPEDRDRDHPAHELEIAVREGRYEEEGWRVRKDGTRFWANVLITALFDKDGTLRGFGKVTRDTTERRELLLHRERAAAELSAANQQLRAMAEEKAEFLAVTAHELRGPVLVMRGGAQMLLDHWTELRESDRIQLLQSLVSGGERMHRLLEDLLMASRLEAGAVDLDIRPTPLCAVLDEAVASMGEQRWAVEVECRPDTLVLADRGRLGQIVSNLLSNAVKYGAPPVTIAAAAAGRVVEMCIRDHGPGVHESLLPRLFTKFARGPGRPDGGTGLGLFIVRELVRAQQGEVWYQPAPGGGAAFTVQLPAGPALAEPA